MKASMNAELFVDEKPLGNLLVIVLKEQENDNISCQIYERGTVFSAPLYFLAFRKLNIDHLFFLFLPKQNSTFFQQLEKLSFRVLHIL